MACESFPGPLGQVLTNLVMNTIHHGFANRPLGQGGSGLGLAVSHRIATTLLQGDLRVESRLGAGTTFTLSFAHVSSLGG